MSRSIQPAEDYVLNGKPYHQDQRFVLMIEDKSNCVNLLYVSENVYDSTWKGEWYVSK